MKSLSSFSLSSSVAYNCFIWFSKSNFSAFSLFLSAFNAAKHNVSNQRRRETPECHERFTFLYCNESKLQRVYRQRVSVYIPKCSHEHGFQPQVIQNSLSVLCPSTQPVLCQYIFYADLLNSSKCVRSNVSFENITLNILLSIVRFPQRVSHFVIGL